MVGVNSDLESRYSDEQFRRLLHKRSIATGRYEREPGTVTSALPLNKHLYYVGKGWTLVSVESEGHGTFDSTVYA